MSALTVLYWYSILNSNRLYSKMVLGTEARESDVYKRMYAIVVFVRPTETMIIFSINSQMSTVRLS